MDDDGSLWAAEQGETDHPTGRGFVRRIAVWDTDGKFVKDFVGTTWYAANNTCLHEQDPTLGPRLRRDLQTRAGEEAGLPAAEVRSPLGQPDDAPFWHWTGAPWTLFGSVRMFRSDVSGTMREYVLQSNGFPILFQADEKGEYRPVLAVGSHEHNKAFPAGQGRAEGAVPVDRPERRREAAGATSSSGCRARPTEPISAAVTRRRATWSGTSRGSS